MSTIEKPPSDRSTGRPAARPLADAIARATGALFALQDPAGYWWAELESNVSITAEVLLLHHLWGRFERVPRAAAERYFRAQQRAHGGWELAYGDGGELSVTIEAYLALRLLGVPADDPALARARAFVLARGGVTRSRIFTKMHLALVGAYDWAGLPSLPPWLMVLPARGPLSIYDLSSWARGSTVPLILLFDRKPVYEPRLQLDELYAEGRDNARFALPSAADAVERFFNGVDAVLKWAERAGAVPFRAAGLALAERWTLERQEHTGDWGGIIPAMLNAMLALRALGYAADDPVVVRGFAAIDGFTITADGAYRVQPCISPVWDTGLAVRALVDAGVRRDDPRLVRAASWLLGEQIVARYGDWAVKNRTGKPGGWAFEFENAWYPDVDDTAVVAMALAAVEHPEPGRVRGALARAAQWVASMQCKTGGWGAFDVDNDKAWLNRIPYGDLKAMIDPSTADVSARVLEMVARCGLDDFDPARFARGLDYLLGEQEADGAWFGRWGVNYVYGTSGALAALGPTRPGERRVDAAVVRGAVWLKSVQNPDGGWGETTATLRGPGAARAGPEQRQPDRLGPHRLAGLHRTAAAHRRRVRSRARARDRLLATDAARRRKLGRARVHRHRLSGPLLPELPPVPAALSAQRAGPLRGVARAGPARRLRRRARREQADRQQQRRRDRRQQPRLDQAAVEAGHDPAVLGQRRRQEAGRRDALEQPAQVAQLEARQLHRAGRAAGRAPRRADVVADRVERAAGEVVASRQRLLVAPPVDEEHDVARFFPEQVLEDAQQRLGEEPVAAHDRERAEADEGVGALAEAEDPELLRIERRIGDRELRRVDAVAVDHVRHQHAVARLLGGLHRDGPADQRVLDRLREGGHHPACSLLDRAGVAPERKRAQARELDRAQLRPGKLLGIVRGVRVDEGAAEQLPVVWRPGSHRGGCAPHGRSLLPVSRQGHLARRWKRVAVVDQVVTAAGAERASRLILPRVSRTFALGIKLLPARLEAPVRIGYLLCRIADTVEDDLRLSPERKAELLDRLSDAFDDAETADAFGACAAELSANDDYLELVATSGRVFSSYRGLDPASREILRRWVREMVRGMRQFVLAHRAGIRIASLPEFREYCYYVAGTVGHLLTELWHAHSYLVGERTLERLQVDCEAFGEALQTINILKDIAWDAEHENAVYIPADLLAAVGSSHDTILRAERRPANRDALAPLIELARADVEHSLRYIEALPAAALRIRLFCVLPVLFAVATMRELERSEAMLVSGGSVKIERAEVQALVVAASGSTLTNASLRWLVERVRKRPFSLAWR